MEHAIKKTHTHTFHNMYWPVSIVKKTY